MAPQVGQALREARTEQGIELSEVERVTKIRTKFLLAMEEERWEALPAPVYARSFLSTYAQFLGLDDQALVDQYRRTVEGVDRAEPIPHTVLRPGALRSRRSIKPVALLFTGLVAAVVLGLVIVGSLGGSDNGGDGADRRGGTAADPTATTTTNGETASVVSLELRSTGAVWVCLVDDEGRAPVNGETLTANEVRGPFDGRGFEVTFGNGSVEMTVDGEPTEIPPVAEPLGYRITPSGVRELDPSSQPNCL
jgi:hypothetical protein